MDELMRDYEKYCNPLNLDTLIEEGIIKKVGKSYYTSNLDNLSREITFYLRKAPKKVRNGWKLEFMHPPKSMR